MTQIEKIRAMSAEELARWLMDVEDGNFAPCFCDEQFCRKFRENPDGKFKCNVGDAAPDKDCVAAALAYLESEVGHCESQKTNKGERHE